MGRTDSERHVKARIALQLLLDAAPLMLMIGFCGCLLCVFSYQVSLEWLMHIGIWGFMLGTVPLCILGKVSRKRMDGLFAAYATCGRVSRILTVLGVIAACWSVLALFLCLLNMIRI